MGTEALVRPGRLVRPRRGDASVRPFGSVLEKITGSGVRCPTGGDVRIADVLQTWTPYSGKSARGGTVLPKGIVVPVEAISRAPTTLIVGPVQAISFARTKGFIAGPREERDAAAPGCRVSKGIGTLGPLPLRTSGGEVRSVYRVHDEGLCAPIRLGVRVLFLLMSEPSRRHQSKAR